MDTNQHPVESSIHDDEINLLEYIYVLVKHKWIIIGMAILGFGLGFIAAKIKGPVYIADAVIIPKETESVSVPNLSGLGMLGGMVSSQMSMGGSAGLDKIEQLLGSRSFNAACVEENNLARFIYPERWDTVNNRWVDTLDGVPYDSSKYPKPVSVGATIKRDILKVELQKGVMGNMTITVTHKDSLAAYTILDSYLKFLDTSIRKSTQENAVSNIEYLESQLVGISDPLLRAKLQEFIAKEVEKSMFVSKEAFKILDDILTKKNFKAKKIYPLLGMVMMSGLAFFIVIASYALGGINTNEEEKKYFEKIKKELFNLPLFKNK